MKRHAISAFALSVGLLTAPTIASAHFILVSPASAVVENVLGDPQKITPCGIDTDRPGTPTNVVTPVTGGTMLHIKVRETVYHPGFFRVALAVLDRAELPADPEDVTREGPRGPISVSAKIDPNPKPPVLVDGIWEHRVRTPAQEFETDLKIPNINCEHCTLQVMQFMEEHGVNKDGRFSYHHCADLKVTRDPKLPLDKAWPGQTKAKRKG